MKKFISLLSILFVLMICNTSLAQIISGGGGGGGTGDIKADGTVPFTGNVTLYDGSTHSPNLIFIDEGNDTATLVKMNGGYFRVTTNEANSGLEIIGGNLKVGNGTPGQTIDGEDFYCEGISEFDAMIYADGGITGNLTGDVTGNAATATALASDPSDCAALGLATAIDASGNLTCGYAIGTDVQAYDAQLDVVAAGGSNNTLFGINNSGEYGYYANHQHDDSAAQFYSATASKGTRKLVQSSISDGILLTDTPVVTGNVTWTNVSQGAGTYNRVFLETDNVFTGANTLGDGGDDQRIVSRINATNERWSGHTIYFAQCAASLAFGTPVYIQSTGKPGAADADAAATMPAIGLIVVASTDADTPCTVLTHGTITDTDWNFTTVGATIYTSETAGSVELDVANISDTNDVVQVLGIALHADTLFVNPSLVTIVLE